jgi:hypothetical protein
MASQGIDLAENNFAARRRIIDLLDVVATLKIEDGQKVVYTECRFGRGKLDLFSHLLF